MLWRPSEIAHNTIRGFLGKICYEQKFPWQLPMVTAMETFVDNICAINTTFYSSVKNVVPYFPQLVLDLANTDVDSQKEAHYPAVMSGTLKTLPNGYK